MKANYLIQILLGGFLALPACVKCTAQPSIKVLTSGSDFTVYASLENMQISSSQLSTYSASGVEKSPLDGSRAAGAQTITYGGGIFTGSGRLNIFPGSGSTVASGETSVFIEFETTNAFHYQFISAVSTADAVNGYVSFNGLSNYNGTVTADGTIGSDTGTNQYVLQVLVAGHDANPGNGTWSYSLALIPANIAAGQFSAAEKAAFYALKASLSILTSQLFSAAAAAPYGAQGKVLAQAGQDMIPYIDQLSQAFLDPLDTNYTVIAPVTLPAVTPLAPDTNITQLEANVYNAWLTNLSASAGYGTALITSINRAQGAAFAGDTFWETAQMNTAVQLEAQLAYLADQEPGLRSNVAAQFMADGFAAITVTMNDAINLQMEITTNGLPAALLDAFTQLGTDPATITNIQEALLTTDPNTMAGSFPGSLANTNLDSSAHALAAGLRDASLELINASLLAGGQFRFDLPTEPGYGYTIQFTQNPASPAGWTAIYSNTAGTALLSFTNAPNLSAKAGFYRASHN